MPKVAGEVSLRRAVVAIVVLLASVSGLRSASAQLTTDVATEANWILSLQLTSGSDKGLIMANTGQSYCVPYFSSTAASGLAAATRATGDQRYVAAAWSWLDWYAAHMDSSGFITN